MKKLRVVLLCYLNLFTAQSVYNKFIIDQIASLEANQNQATLRKEIFAGRNLLNLFS